MLLAFFVRSFDDKDERERRKERVEHRWKFSSWSNESVFICMQWFSLWIILARCEENRRGKRRTILHREHPVVDVLSPHTQVIFMQFQERNAFHPRENIFAESFTRKGENVSRGWEIQFRSEEKFGRRNLQPGEKPELFVNRFDRNLFSTSSCLWFNHSRL